MFETIKRLLPRSTTWLLAEGKGLTKVAQGYADFAESARAYLGQIALNVDFDETAYLDEWAEALALLGANDDQNLALGKLQVRKDRNVSAKQLQDHLHAAGFTDLFVHEYFEPDREPFDFSSAIVTEKKVDLPGASGFAFALRGSILIMISSDDTIIAYRLPKPYVLADLEPYGSEFNPSLSLSNGDLFVSKDGEHLLLLDDGDGLHSYSLTSADPGSAVLVGSIDLAVPSAIASHIAVSDDGSKVYVGCSTAIAGIFQYDLATAWDASTAAPGVSVSTTLAVRGLDYARSKLVVIDSAQDAREIVLVDDSLTGALSAPVGVSGVAFSREMRFGGSGGLGYGYDNGTRAFLLNNAGEIFQVSLADYEPRDPFDYINQPLIGTVRCGEPRALCGDPDARCNGFLVNEVNYLVWSSAMPFAPPGFPTDPRYWSGVFYICGETFGDFVEMNEQHRARLVELILKLKRARLWCVLMVTFTFSGTLSFSSPSVVGHPQADVALDSLLQENGYLLLQEDGSRILI